MHDKIYKMQQTNNENKKILINVKNNETNLQSYNVITRIEIKKNYNKKKWHYTNENKNNCCKSEDD